MDNQLFQEIFRKQQESDGRAYWNDLYEKYSDQYVSKEALRSAFKQEKRKRIETGEIPDARFEEKTSYEEGNDFINIVCASRRMRSKEDIIEEFNIDLEKWEVERFRVKTSEGYRKDRIVEWDVEDGRVSHGHVRDTGKMLVVPLYHVEVRLVRKKSLFTIETVDKLFDSLLSKTFPSYKSETKNYNRDGVYAIVPIFDLHLGLYATEAVEGNDYSIDLAEKYFYDIVNQAKERLSNRKIKEIYFLVGNDFLNSDNLERTTTKGTPQDTETSWFNLIDKAIELIVNGAKSLSELSVVNVIIIPSNHDRHSLYSIGKVVEQYFVKSKDIFVDNSPVYAKYFLLGKTIVGLTHDIQIKRALEVMTTSARELWSQANYAVWLLGHLHRQMQYERQGVLEIYRIPAVSGNSRWASEKHYVQPDRRSQVFIIDQEDGITDVMNIVVK